jgi:uncharacterized protein (DUF1810 family)
MPAADSLSPMAPENDPFNLQRFVSAQEGAFATALAELKAGQKRSHWMWFIFPQLRGLGSSETARFYAIASLTEARTYLAHPILGPRLFASIDALLSSPAAAASDVFGYPDDLKFRSSMTLFEAADPQHAQFVLALDRLCAGRRDQATLRLLAASPPDRAAADWTLPPAIGEGISGPDHR